MKLILGLVLFYSSLLLANPYPDPTKVISPSIKFKSFVDDSFSYGPRQGSRVLRIEVDWKDKEIYSIGGQYLERSGTPALIKSSKHRDYRGSYKAQLKFIKNNNEIILHSSVGTGREFRYLVRTLSFRFPLSENIVSAIFSLEAENPQTGKLEKVLEKEIFYSQFKEVPTQEVKVSILRKALKEPSLKFNIYAEGFGSNGEQKFLEASKKVIQTLEKSLPGSEYFEFRAVFAESKTKLGQAIDLGPSIKVRDSFLGLYYPYWRKIGRWYNIVYPTSQTRYRNAIAQVDYDYPLALVDDGNYWGVGNYKELTAVPTDNYKFSYLLLHEFGHFMGLNEEYEGGGPTELEFAPGIQEPWSQNITFNPDPEKLKWLKHTEPGISLPTTMTDYSRFGGRTKNPVGAYPGGYADSLPEGKSHKPVMQCMMGSGGNFCPVCQEALKELVLFDLGL